MNKLGLLMLCGILSACSGGDAGKEEQTYRSLMDAAKSDPVKLSSQIANNVTVKLNPAMFSGNELGGKYVLMRHNQSQDASKAEVFTATFIDSEKSKIEGKPEITAICARNSVEAGLGIQVSLKDCVAK